MTHLGATKETKIHTQKTKNILEKITTVLSGRLLITNGEQGKSFHFSVSLPKNYFGIISANSHDQRTSVSTCILLDYLSISKDKMCVEFFLFIMSAQEREGGGFEFYTL